MTRYIATVHLVFEADSEAEAADTVSAMLPARRMRLRPGLVARGEGSASGTVFSTSP